MLAGGSDIPNMITVVTSTSNPVPQHIDATAASLFAQTYGLFEWVLVDDHSRNQWVLDTYRHHPDKRIRVTSCPGLSQSSQNCGLARARKVGLWRVRTPYVLFLNDDDIIDPTYLEKLLWLLQCHTEFDYADTFTAVFGEERPMKKNMTHNSIMESRQIVPALVRTSALSALAGWPKLFDKSLIFGMGDWDMWVNWKIIGHHGVTIPEYLLHYRSRGQPRQRDFIVDSNGVNSKVSNWHESLHQRYPLLFAEGGRRHLTLRKPTENDVCMTTTARAVPLRDHVLLIVPWLAFGGANRANMQLSQSLVEIGFNVSLITTLSTSVRNSTSPDMDAYRSEVLRHTHDIFILPHFLSASSYLNFIVNIARSRGSRSIIISNSEVAYNLLPFIRAELPDVLIMDYVHMYEQDWTVSAFFESVGAAGGHSRLSAVFSEYIDMSLYASQDVMQYARAAFKLTEGHMQRVMYMGIPVPVPQPVLEQWGVAPEVVRVLFVGRLTQQNRPLLVVSLLTGLNVLLVVVGDGPLCAPMESACQEAGVRSVFLGSITVDAMGKVFASCHMLLTPSVMEGLSTAAIDASMHGLPVIGTHVGGQSEIVTPETGLIFALNDTVGLRDGVQKFVTSASERKAFGNRAAQFAHKKFGVDQMRTNIAQVLHTTRIRPRTVHTNLSLESAIQWLIARTNEKSFEAMYSREKWRPVQSTELWQKRACEGAKEVYTHSPKARPFLRRSFNTSGSSHTRASKEIDIGLVYACTPERWRHFKDSFNLSDTWKNTVRFLIVNFKCENPTKTIVFPKTLRGVPLVIVESTAPWTRSKNRNLLMAMVRPGARVLLLDIDLSINDLALVNVLRNVHPGVVYFPVVWSLYSPESISYVEHATLSPVQAFSEDQGTWRKYGFGIVAIHADDVRKVQWDEAFEGWGGEDNAFHRSVETTPGLRIVRQNDEGLIHAFHEKHCSGVTKRQKKSLRGRKGSLHAFPKSPTLST